MLWLAKVLSSGFAQTLTAIISYFDHEFNHCQAGPITECHQASVTRHLAYAILSGLGMIHAEVKPPRESSRAPLWQCCRHALSRKPKMLRALMAVFIVSLMDFGSSARYTNSVRAE
jgi:hypothetical protein